MQSCGEPFHKRQIQQCFGVAMGMDDYVRGLRVEMQRLGFGFEEVFDEILKQKAPFRDLLGIRQFQLAIILDEHRVTGRFQK